MSKHTGKTEYEIRKKNSGAALMVVVIIIGILMVFTLSLVLVTYTLYASQNKKAASKKNSEAANTLSIALTTELTGTNAEAGELWRYLRFNLCQEDTWPYYDPECTADGHGSKEAFRYFDLKVNYTEKYFSKTEGTEVNEDSYSALEGFPGSVKLCVYWMLPTNLVPEDKSEVVDVATVKASKGGLRLFVEVICETASQTYVVKNEYELQIDTITDKKAQRTLQAYANTEKVKTYNPIGLSAGSSGTEAIDTTEKWIWNFVGKE